MVWEVIGWIGSLAVVLSLVLASQVKFRALNLAGSGIAALYNLVLGVWPMVLMNSAIVIIDLYWLVRLLKASPDKDAQNGSASPRG